MDDAKDDIDEAAPALPKEADRRHVEDADARGIPVVLQGGEAWYVPPLPLSPRGQRIAQALDEIEALEVDLAAAQRGVAILAEQLDSAATEDAVETVRDRLRSAAAKRTKCADDLSRVHREVAWHALRSHYRVTREEAGLLVTQRHWPDIMAALNGKDTTRSQEEMALALLARLKGIERGMAAADGPFGPAGRSSSAGPAAS